MTRSPEVSPQASLRQLCPDLQALPNSKGSTLLRWALETVNAYRVCQDRHARLVEATAPIEPGKVDYTLKR